MGNIWLIDSGCSRNMTEDRGWFSSLTPVVSKVYIKGVNDFSIFSSRL
jgi:hypothetical protein